MVGQDCILQAGFSTGLLAAEQPRPKSADEIGAAACKANVTEFFGLIANP
jgi:hypothetical protein